MATAIVIGGDSTIGGALVQVLSRRGDTVYPTTRRPLDNRQGWLHVDLTNPNLSAARIPVADVAYFAAAYNGFAKARMEPALARQVNVVGTAALARQLARRGVQVVLLSSTAVFDFSEPRVRADRTPCARTVYGQIKIETEAEFSKLGPPASIVRLTKVLTSDMPLFTNWIGRLRRGAFVTAFSDMRLAPISLAHATAALLAAAEDKVGGIYQFSAGSDISYANAARHLAMRLGADPALVRETTAVESGIPPEEVAWHTSLDMSRLGRIMGRSPPDPYDVLDAVYGGILADTRERAASKAP
jgi:dTDP-4-dehydrorhamnose reductase